MKRIILLVLCLLVVTRVYGSDTKKLYNKTVTSVVALSVENSRGGCIGTGFFALESDIIVTCYHVVEGATNITAKTNKGKVVTIEGIIDYSEEKDIALLKASSKNSTLLDLQANMPTPGTPAYVLGSPQGLDFSFSNGMVSQIRRGKETLIQFTSPVSPGNSGGPLLSEDGKVIGIVSCQLTEGQNLNFAVPSASVYMLNKDNAITKIQNSNFVSNSSSSSLNIDEAIKHCELGNKYTEALLYDAAEKEYFLALNNSPNNLLVLTKLSGCYLLSYQYRKLKIISEEGIKISIEDNNSSYLGHFYYGLAESYMGLENYDKALEYFSLIAYLYLDKQYFAATEDNNFNIVQYSIFNKIAICYYYKSKYRESIDYYNKSLEYCERISTYLGIGVCYLLLEDYTSAQKYAEKVLQIDPNDKKAKRLLEDCKKQLRRR